MPLVALGGQQGGADPPGSRRERAEGGAERAGGAGSLRPGAVGRRIDPVLGELQLEVLAVHADLLGRLRDVAVVTLERLDDELALEALDDAAASPP